METTFSNRPMNRRHSPREAVCLILLALLLIALAAVLMMLLRPPDGDYLRHGSGSGSCSPSNLLPVVRSTVGETAAPRAENAAADESAGYAVDMLLQGSARDRTKDVVSFDALRMSADGDCFLAPRNTEWCLFRYSGGQWSKDTMVTTGSLGVACSMGIGSRSEVLGAVVRMFSCQELSSSLLRLENASLGKDGRMIRAVFLDRDDRGTCKVREERYYFRGDLNEETQGLELGMSIFIPAGVPLDASRRSMDRWYAQYLAMGQRMEEIGRMSRFGNPAGFVPIICATNGEAGRNDASSTVSLVHLRDGAPQSSASNTALRLALVSLPIGSGWVRDELDRGRTAFDVARSLYSGRKSDILYAGTDDKASLLFVIGVDGAIAAIADDYPRFVRATNERGNEENKTRAGR